MNRQHNRSSMNGEEMDLSHLIDSGNDTRSVISNNNTPNNNTNSTKSNSGRSNVTIMPNSNTSSIQSNNITSNNTTSNDEDPLQAFLNDPNKASRNAQNKEKKIQNEIKKERTPQEPIPRTDIPEVNGKITAFVPYQKNGVVSFHSFSIETKTTTNVMVDHITPPYVKQSNKKNNAK